MKKFIVPVTRDHEVYEGWGVSVDVLHGQDDDGNPRDVVLEVDTEIVYIASSTVKVIGDAPCVQLDSGGYVPTSLFLINPPPADDDQIDLRSRLFATLTEATDYAADVEQEWASPNPWQAFVRLD